MYKTQTHNIFIKFSDSHLYENFQLSTTTTTAKRREEKKKNEQEQKKIRKRALNIRDR